MGRIQTTAVPLATCAEVDGANRACYKIAELRTDLRSVSDNPLRKKTPMIAALFSLPEGNKSELLMRDNNLTNSDVIVTRKKPAKMPVPAIFLRCFTLLSVHFSG